MSSAEMFKIHCFGNESLCDCEYLAINHNSDDTSEFNNTVNAYKNNQNEKNLSSYVIKKFTFQNLSNLTVLSLPNCGIVQLPTVFNTLSLMEFNLSNNHLFHVPKCLYMGLECIEILNLSFNPISHFSNKPKCSNRLKILNLQSCHFKSVPNWILEMKALNLQDLNFSNNPLLYLERLDKPLLPVKLKSLILQNVDLRSAMLNFIKSFCLLQYLDLSNELEKFQNQIININDLFHVVPCYPALKVLKLNKLNINEVSENICNLINLEELSLRHNNLCRLPSFIYNLKHLKKFDVSYNCLFNLPNMNPLQKLMYLSAADNHINTVSLENLMLLKYLDLYNNCIDTFYLDAAIIQSIEFLDLDQNYLELNVIECLESYDKKKGALRLLEPIGVRLNGQKMVSPVEKSEESEYNESDSNYSMESEEDYNCNESSFRQEDNKSRATNEDDDNCSEWSDFLNEVTPSDSELEFETLTIINPPTGVKLAVRNNSIENLFIDGD